MSKSTDGKCVREDDTGGKSGAIRTSNNDMSRVVTLTETLVPHPWISTRPLSKGKTSFKTT